MPIQSISKDCCIVGKRRNLFQKKGGRLNYQTAWYVLHRKKKMEKGTLKWVKVQQKGSKHNSLAMVTDNLNWWSIAIKLSTLFLHLTFAVRIKLYLAARTAIVYDNNRISKAAPRRGVGLSTVYLIYFLIENIEFIFHLSLIELFSVIFIAANRGQRKCSLPPQLRSVFHDLWSSSSSVWP